MTAADAVVVGVATGLLRGGMAATTPDEAKKATHVLGSRPGHYGGGLSEAWRVAR